MGENQNVDPEDTQRFDTGEFLREETETADRKKPLESLRRLYLRARYKESIGQPWGAVLCLQEALAVLPYTSLSVAKQEYLSSKFIARIDDLNTRRKANTKQWPGEPAKLPETPELTSQPKPIRVLAAKLGLMALGH